MLEWFPESLEWGLESQSRYLQQSMAECVRCHSFCVQWDHSCFQLCGLVPSLGQDWRVGPLRAMLGAMLASE